MVVIATIAVTVGVVTIVTVVVVVTTVAMPTRAIKAVKMIVTVRNGGEDYGGGNVNIKGAMGVAAMARE